MSEYLFDQQGLWLGNLALESMAQHNDGVSGKVKQVSNKSIILCDSKGVSLGCVSICYSWMGERKRARFTK